MSDHDSNFIKTFGGVIVGLGVLAFILYFAAQYVIEESGIMNTREAEQIYAAAVDKRIAPIGRVRLQGDKLESAAAAAPAAPRSAADIVSGTCGACHNSGVLGAPKIGTKSDWEPRYANGLAGLVKNAIHGLNAMPPRGGAADLTDAQIEAAIAHMLKDSGFDIEVPDTAPTPAAAEPVAAAPAAEAEAAPVLEAAVAEVKEAAAPVTGAVSNMMGDMTSAVSDAVDTATDAAVATGNAVSDATSSAVAAVTDDGGEKVYNNACVACHSSGVAGSPRFGDTAAWTARIAQGMDTLNDHALNGYRGMPPKGGRRDLSDADVIAAVRYMVDGSK